MKQLLIILLFLGAPVIAAATTYQYDDAGRLVKVQFNNGMETRYTYDLSGNLVGKATDVINSVDNEMQEPKSVVVAPTPSADWARIQLPDWNGVSIEISISTITGTVVQRVTRIVEFGQVSIDVRHLPVGTYQVACKNKDASVSAALVIVR